MLNAINTILRKDWDPNGLGEVGPANEYATFSNIIAAELAKGWSIDDLATYLSFVREHWLQGQSNKLEDRRIAVLIFCAAADYLYASA